MNRWVLLRRLLDNSASAVRVLMDATTLVWDGGAPTATDASTAVVAATAVDGAEELRLQLPAGRHAFEVLWRAGGLSQ